jgi:hypothetical protein
MEDMGVMTGNAKDAFDALTGSTGVQFKDMSAIAQKYGADLNNLGPKFEAAKIHDTANTIINDFDTLQRGLGDTDEALTIMKKPINDLVNQSIKFGVDIPANMQPWVDQLEKTGQLTDENGDKITDLSKIKFSDSIETQFQTLIDKISKLIDTINGPQGLSTAINNIPAKKESEIVITTHHRDVQDAGDSSAVASGGLVTSYGIHHFAAGKFPWKAIGSDTIPAMLSPGEIVMNAAQQRNVASNLSGAQQSAGGAGSGAVTIHNNFAIAADIDSAASRDRFMRAVDEATMSAMRRQKRLQVA